MFIEAKLQLSSIKFDGKKKKIDVTELGKLFDSKCLDEMDVPPPPANDSDTTLKEIKDMVNNRNTLSPFKKNTNLQTKTLLTSLKITWMTMD